MHTVAVHVLIFYIKHMYKEVSWYLNFAPESTFLTADAVHDSRDIEKLPSELFFETSSFTHKQLCLVEVVRKAPGNGTWVENVTQGVYVYDKSNTESTCEYSMKDLSCQIIIVKLLDQPEPLQSSVQS